METCISLGLPNKGNLLDAQNGVENLILIAYQNREKDVELQINNEEMLTDSPAQEDFLQH